MKKIRVRELCSQDNEIHLVIQEQENYGYPDHDFFSRAEVKEMMKKEAAKPLLLLRAE